MPAALLVGVPEITPVVELNDNPILLGKPVAPKPVSGPFVAVIWYENAAPIWPVAVVGLVTRGRPVADANSSAPIAGGESHVTPFRSAAGSAVDTPWPAAGEVFCRWKSNEPTEFQKFGDAETNFGSPLLQFDVVVPNAAVACAHV